jgi:hypothetical protein
MSRLRQVAFGIVGILFGGLLLAGVGLITHHELLGGILGSIAGAVVGLGVWAGKISAVTVGGILGAIFFAAATCPPTGFVAPWGYLIGAAIAYVLRGIWRALHPSDKHSPCLTWLWLVWLTSVVLSMAGVLNFLIPAYGVLFLLALEVGPPVTRG